MASGYADSVNLTALTEVYLDDNLMKQAVLKYASAATRTADAALSAALREGMVSYLDDVNTLAVYSGSVWSTIGPVHGALTSWTPVVVQGATPTLSVNYATYSRVGRRVTAQALVTLTSAGTAANVITMTLPVNCALVSDYFTIGNGILGDASDAGTGWRPLFVTTASASTVRFYAPTANAQPPVGPGATLTLANGDFLMINVTYEAAADA